MSNCERSETIQLPALHEGVTAARLLDCFAPLA
jgi:hypothetical protein